MITVSINERECSFDAWEGGRLVARLSWDAAKQAGASFNARCIVARGYTYRTPDGRLWGKVRSPDSWAADTVHETGGWEEYAGPAEELTQVGGDNEWISEWWDMVSWSPISGERDGDLIVFRRVDGWELSRTPVLEAPVVGDAAPPPLVDPQTVALMA